MAHESFHRVQPQLGLKPLDAANDHLDGRIGRTWLQLEWRALARALATSRAGRRDAIADALYFRALRRKLLSNAAMNENRLEVNEGIAEYTGVKLSARYAQEAALVAEVTLWQGPNRSPFVRSFAYVSGPAYGVLLDQSGIAWRHRLKPDSDLGALLREAYHISADVPITVNEVPCQAGQVKCCGRCQSKPCNIACMKKAGAGPGPELTEVEAGRRAQKYDGDELIAQEKNREASQQKIITAERTRLIEKPVLVLPASPEVNYSFDPNQVTAVNDDMSVYDGDVQVMDAWGILTSPNGILFIRENGRIARVQVPAPVNPSASPITGEGWKLELKTGWKLVPGPRSGDWTAQRQ
jgi:hypothetical protein